MRDIDIHQIEIFLAVAKCRNISQAAQELYISQSAVSSRINKMEAELGARLFYRTNRGVSLTPKGEELYARLDIAYHRFRVSANEIFRSIHASGGVLRFGYLHRKDMALKAGRALKIFAERYPDTEIESEMFNFHELRDKLLCDELDLILSVSYDISAYPEFDRLDLCPFPAYFYVPATWKKQMDEGAGFSYLDGKTMVLEARTGYTPAENICSAYGFRPGGVRFVNSYILMQTLVAREECFALFGEFVADDINHGNIELIPAGCGNNASITAAWRHGRLSENGEKLLRILEETAGK